MDIIGSSPPPSERSHRTDTLEAPSRLATEADAAELADLVNFAGEGLTLHVWARPARKGEDPWDIRRARQVQKARDGEIILLDHGNGAVAGPTWYEIGPDTSPVEPGTSVLFRPLQELDNLAPGSCYTNVLACYPEVRGSRSDRNCYGLRKRSRAGIA